MGSEDVQIAAWRGLLEAGSRLLERVEADLNAAGLPPLAWYDVLFALAEAEGQRLRMHELAERLVLSRSNLTRLADRLEAEGLIGRERDPADRRGAYAVLTAAGAARRREMWPVYSAAIGRYFGSHLSTGEARTLRDLLDRLAQANR